MDERGRQVEGQGSVGPFREGDSITLECHVPGGKLEFTIYIRNIIVSIHFIFYIPSKACWFDYRYEYGIQRKAKTDSLSFFHWHIMRIYIALVQKINGTKLS